MTLEQRSGRVRLVSGPPPALVATLVQGPSLVAGVEWHAEVASTQERALAAARDGAPEMHLVLADTQTAGRGRHGRTWQAPPGTSLLASCVLRPAAPSGVHALLPLLAGVALAEVAERYCPQVALKWPNDLLLGGCKGAGILAETAPGGVVVLGVGVNVDWRGQPRPADAPDATSLAEAGGGAVDRWRVLAAFVGLFGRRYLDWQEQPTGFLDAYRRRCATIGLQVRLSRGDQMLRGTAEAVGEDGLLELRDGHGTLHRLWAGDVEHVRAP